MPDDLTPCPDTDITPELSNPAVRGAVNEVRPKVTGRPPKAWAHRMDAVLKRSRAAKVMERMISGDILERVGQQDDGTPIYGETKNADRLGAIKLAAAYAHGQPIQAVQVEATVKSFVVVAPVVAKDTTEWTARFSPETSASQ